jgi:plasmid maintenance system antidote protein VapI
MAVRIALATNTSAESWLNMQMKLDLWEASQNKGLRPLCRCRMIYDRIRDLCCGNYLDSARREWSVNA